MKSWPFCPRYCWTVTSADLRGCWLQAVRLAWKGSVFFPLIFWCWKDYSARELKSRVVLWYLSGSRLNELWRTWNMLRLKCRTISKSSITVRSPCVTLSFIKMWMYTWNEESKIFLSWIGTWRNKLIISWESSGLIFWGCLVPWSRPNKKKTQNGKWWWFFFLFFTFFGQLFAGILTEGTDHRHIFHNQEYRPLSFIYLFI